MDGVRELAAAIDCARRERRLLDAAAQSHLDLRAAYAVQRELTALRMSRGANLLRLPRLPSASPRSCCGSATGPRA
jgi:hypothetical protein